jgi:hypothetical protein
LDEQKAFYDEVERIGQKVGTVTTKEGQVAVAPQHSSHGSDSSLMKNPRIKQVKTIEHSHSSSALLQKRKLPVGNAKHVQSPPSKRPKNGHEDRKPDVSNSSKNSSVQASQNVEDKPKKPLSAYIYFSQEFREIIRMKFPFLTVAQIMKAVSYRWSSLTKE